MYPLKFDPIPLEKIWGGEILNQTYGHNVVDPIGELLLVSGLKGQESVVSNGEYKGQTLNYLIDSYKALLLGEKNYATFKNEFPLLIKIIDAADDLSIQVHPDDHLAKKWHDGSGKSEMWYVMDTHDENASLISGFSRITSKDEFKSHYESGQLMQLMNSVKITPGDVYYIPAGKVHSIGKGALIAEIQQPSDLTYRIYDFDRKDQNGNSRELHHELAYKAMNFEDCDTGLQNTHLNDSNLNDNVIRNTKDKLVANEYFITNKISIEQEYIADYESVDSFVVLLATEGSCEFQYRGNSYSLSRFESILIPATVDKLLIQKTEGGKCKLLEIYV